MAQQAHKADKPVQGMERGREGVEWGGQNREGVGGIRGDGVGRTAGRKAAHSRSYPFSLA